MDDTTANTLFSKVPIKDTSSLDGERDEINRLLKELGQPNQNRIVAPNGGVLTMDPITGPYDDSPTFNANAKTWQDHVTNLALDSQSGPKPITPDVYVDPNADQKMIRSPNQLMEPIFQDPKITQIINALGVTGKDI